jgi:hypothetical protein
MRRSQKTDGLTSRYVGLGCMRDGFGVGKKADGLTTHRLGLPFTSDGFGVARSLMGFWHRARQALPGTCDAILGLRSTLGFSWG